MNTHLSPEDFVDALDDARDSRVQLHLAACASCRRDLDAARAAMQEAHAVEIPEPSPLFWDHFSARVADATQEVVSEATREADGAPAPWWQSAWRTISRPSVAIAGALAVVMMVLVLRPDSTPVTVSTSNDAPVTPAMLPMSDDDGTWVLVEGLAAELHWGDVHQAAEPAAGTADAMIEELTPAQRDAFVRLLQREMGDL